MATSLTNRLTHTTKTTRSKLIRHAVRSIDLVLAAYLMLIVMPVVDPVVMVGVGAVTVYLLINGMDKWWRYVKRNNR